VLADELNGGIERRSRSEDGRDAARSHGGTVLVGDGPAEDEEDVFGVLLAEQGGDAGNEDGVGAREDGEANAVDVLLNGGVHDAFGGLPEAGVDDLHAGVAEGAGDDLGAAIVSVEAGLGNQNANWGGAGHVVESIPGRGGGVRWEGPGRGIRPG
jgi:hypothetical protein